jgi:hypothetical protein
VRWPIRRAVLLADDTIGVAEPVDDDLPQIITHRVGVPLRPEQQPLHRIRSGMTSLLSHLPAGLDLQLGQQPGHEPSRRTAGLDPAERPANESITRSMVRRHRAGSTPGLLHGIATVVVCRSLDSIFNLLSGVFAGPAGGATG